MPLAFNSMIKAFFLIQLQFASPTNHFLKKPSGSWSGARRPRRRHFGAGYSISSLSRIYEASGIHGRIESLLSEVLAEEIEFRLRGARPDL